MLSHINQINFNQIKNQWEYKEKNQIKITLPLSQILPYYSKQQEISFELYSYTCFLLKLETLGIIQTLNACLKI